MAADDTIQRIWTVCVFALIGKTWVPDAYIAYFKWVQARDARHARGVDHTAVDVVVRFLSDGNAHVLIAAVIVCNAVMFLLIPMWLRFPLLTLIGLLSAALLSAFGALGDWMRSHVRA